MANPNKSGAPETPAATSAEVVALQKRLAEAEAQLEAATAPAEPPIKWVRWQVEGDAFHSNSTGYVAQGGVVLLPEGMPGAPQWINLDTGEVNPVRPHRRNPAADAKTRPRGTPQLPGRTVHLSPPAAPDAAPAPAAPADVPTGRAADRSPTS